MTTVVDTILHGRWLHFGAMHQSPGLEPGRYSAADWDHWCSLAAQWGMTGVHPKVAEGTYLWYNDTELAMLKTIAQRHKLLIAPYHYVYGGTFGSGPMQTEEQIVAHIGKTFGCVVLDMESQWSNHGAWVEPFAKGIRAAGYTGHLIPTTFANPAQHGDIPYLLINYWLSSAWMPQVYFDLWTLSSGQKMTAQNAIDYVYPQWLALDGECHKITGKALAPVLPIIDLYGKPPQAEVTNWLNKMHGYGYCGFWYADVYEPYATSVLHGTFPGALPAPALVVHPPTSTTPTSTTTHGVSAHPAVPVVAPVVVHPVGGAVPPPPAVIVPVTKPKPVVATPDAVSPPSTPPPSSFSPPPLSTDVEEEGEPVTALIPVVSLPVSSSPSVVSTETTTSTSDAWLNSTSTPVVPPSVSVIMNTTTPTPPAPTISTEPITPTVVFGSISSGGVIALGNTDTEESTPSSSTPLPDSPTSSLPVPTTSFPPYAVMEPVSVFAIDLSQLVHLEAVGTVLYTFYRGSPIQELRAVGTEVEAALASHEPMSALSAKLGGS